VKIVCILVCFVHLATWWVGIVQLGKQVVMYCCPLFASFANSSFEEISLFQKISFED
jgi:hypothetical protein